MINLDYFREVIEQRLHVLGVELYDLKYIRAGSHSALKIFIDKESGVTIQDCENVSHELSVLLDVENFSNNPYTLEVSSPGLDRVLTTEKDFSRAKGRKVSVRLHGYNGMENSCVCGTVISCIDGTLCLEINKEKNIIPFSQVLSGKVEITFNSV